MIAGSRICALHGSARIFDQAKVKEWDGEHPEQTDLGIHEEFTGANIEPLHMGESTLEPCSGSSRSTLKLIDLPVHGACRRQEHRIVGRRSESVGAIRDRERLAIFSAERQHEPEPVQQASPHWMLRSFIEQRVGSLESGFCFIACTKDPSGGKTVKDSDGDLQRDAIRPVRRLFDQG